MGSLLLVIGMITVLSLAVIAVCKLVFGLYALRKVPPQDRPEVIRSIGEAWSRWTRL